RCQACDFAILAFWKGPRRRLSRSHSYSENRKSQAWHYLIQKSAIEISFLSAYYLGAVALFFLYHIG
ncbi:MAG TPA: hypothetical protein VNG94_05895, partial [Pyrinomonadaceae bacterium]|nr:hypothetical protein [Pyrinomonadaceae bacterium]